MVSTDGMQLNIVKRPREALWSQTFRGLAMELNPLFLSEDCRPAALWFWIQHALIVPLQQWGQLKSFLIYSVTNQKLHLKWKSKEISKWRQMQKLFGWNASKRKSWKRQTTKVLPTKTMRQPSNLQPGERLTSNLASWKKLPDDSRQLHNARFMWNRKQILMTFWISQKLITSSNNNNIFLSENMNILQVGLLNYWLNLCWI